MEKQEFEDNFNNASKDIIKIIDKGYQEKLYTYMNSLIEWNSKINLTAITKPEEIIKKHFIDSLTVLPYIEDKNKIIDVGTGGGFPGIPLAIVCENSNFCLMDSLNKRINFLNEVIKEIGLKNVKAIHSRAEDLAHISEYREKYDIAVSRAVASLPTLLEYMLPFVKVGGSCICMKGPNISEELENSQNAIEILGGKLKKVENISLNDAEDTKRNLIIIEKIKNTTNKYPRKAGIPNKQPII